MSKKIPYKESRLIGYSEIVRSLFRELFAGNTGSFNSLDQEPLAEKIHYNERQYNHYRAGVHNCLIEQRSARLINRLSEWRRYRQYLCKDILLPSGEEYRYIEVISPLP